MEQESFLSDRLIESPRRHLRSIAVSVFLASSFGMGTAYAQATNYDLLVNHEAGFTYDGVEEGASNVNGPIGGEFTYRAKVRINGAGGRSVPNAQLKEVLPAGSIFNGADLPAGVTCQNLPGLGTEIAANHEILCTIPQITSDAFVNVDFRVILPNQSAGWTARASVSAPNNTEPPSGLGNHENIARNITVYQAADLKVEFTAPAKANPFTTVTEGSNINYAIQVTNKNGTYGKDLVAGEQVVVRFEQPAGVTFGNTSPGGAAWNCSKSGTPAVWTCTYNVTATINKGSNLPSLTIPAGANTLGDVAAAVSVSSRSTTGNELRDVEPDDNIDQVSVKVVDDPSTNVTLAKGVTPTLIDEKITTGQTVTYTITPRWASGTANPGDLTVTDQIPAGVTINTLNSNGWTCNPAPINSGATLTCTFPEGHADYPVRGGNFPAITLTGQAVVPTPLPNPKEITNTARVSAANEDPSRTDDNEATAKITISNKVNLRAAKAALSSTGGSVTLAKNGDVLTYRIRVTNPGPLAVLPSQEITVTDNLSSNLEYLGLVTAASASVGSNPNSAGNWTCTNNSVPLNPVGAPLSCTNSSGLAAANATSDLFIRVKVTGLGPDVVTKLNNTASLTGVTGRDTFTAITTNNAQISVSEKPADLAITKTHAVTSDEGVGTAADPAKSGDLVTYTLTVTNSGTPAANQPAGTVVVEDKITNLITNQYKDVPFSIAPITGGAGPALGTIARDFLVVSVAGAPTDAPDAYTCDLGTYNGSQPNADLKCTFKNMPLNATYTITVRAKQFVDPYVGLVAHVPTGVTADGKRGIVSNTATVNSPDTVNTGGQTKTSETTNVVMTGWTDLTVAKAASPLNGNNNPEASAGGAITYTVTATNSGPSAANLMTLEDTLPLGSYWVGGAPVIAHSGTCGIGAADGVAYADNLLIDASNQKMVCAWPNNSPAGQRTVSYKLRSAHDAVGPLHNEVEVSTRTEELNYDNNTAEVDVLLTKPQVDVLVEMRHSADGIALGESTTYTITVTNNQGSSSYATNVVLKDRFHGQLQLADGTLIDSSAFFEFGSITSVSSTGRDNGAAPFSTTNCTSDNTANAGGLECTFASMAPGESVNISFTMKADSLPVGNAVGTIFHNASVSAAYEDLDGIIVTDNNQTTDRTSTYDPQLVDDPNNPPKVIDLALTKSVTNTEPVEAGKPLGAGGFITYSLLVKNMEAASSGLISTDGKVVDVLPRGLVLQQDSLPTPACSYTPGTRTIECEVGTLNPQAEKAFDFRVQLSTPYTGTSPVVNEAEVRSPFDPVPGNNRSKTSTPVQLPPAPVPGLSLFGIAALALMMLFAHARVRRRMN